MRKQQLSGNHQMAMDHYGMITGLYPFHDATVRDVEGNEIKRTKQEYRYAFDDFVSWVNPKYHGLTKDFMKIEVEEGLSKAESYSDRLREWDADKFNAAFDKHLKPVHGMQGARPGHFRAFLADYFGDPELVLVKITECCHQASGFPIWCFSYIYTQTHK